MTNSKSTKRALASSILATFMCVAMLVGMTFAWFTDTASTGVNKIQAGNLKVDIVDAESEEHVDKLDFTKAEGVSEEEILWEPGCRYLTEGFKIANKGNLALKWKVGVNKGTKGENDAKSLLDVIEFSIVDKDGNAINLNTFEEYLMPNGLSDKFYIQGHMDEKAGNDYQNLELNNISITVYATQYAAEFDSYNNQYDKDADYLDKWDGTIAASEELAAATNDGAMTVTVDSARVLAALGQEINKGKDYAGYTITLTKDIDLAGFEWTPIGSGKIYTTNAYNVKVYHDVFRGTFDGNGHTISNLTVNSDEKAGLFGDMRGNVKNLTMNNANVVGHSYAGVIAGYSTVETGKDMSIKNCTVTNSTVTVTTRLTDNYNTHGDGDKAGGIIGYCAYGFTVDRCTVTKTAIKGYRDLGGIAGCALGQESGINITNNKVDASVTVIQDNADDYKPGENKNVGGIVGRSDEKTDTTGCIGGADVVIKTVS